MSKLNTFQRVRYLPNKKAIAFACALLERAYPNWKLFCEATEHCSAEDARNILNLCWEFLHHKNSFSIDVQLDNIFEQTPEPSDMDFFGVYPAVDFCMSLSASLQFLKNQQTSEIVNVAKMSQGTVVGYIELEHPEIENQALREHPLMQWEVAVQNELLDCLEKSKQIPSREELQQIVLSEGCSNIGVEL